MNRYLTVIDHSKFERSREGDTVTLVVEISELQMRSSNLMKRIWADAYDVGFKIKGRQSEVAFTLVGEDKDADGDILGWRFVSIPEVINGVRTEVLVIND